MRHIAERMRVRQIVEIHTGTSTVRSSSWGCMIFDAIIAIWFLAGAPALIGRRTQASRAT